MSDIRLIALILAAAIVLIVLVYNLFDYYRAKRKLAARALTLEGGLTAASQMRMDNDQPAAPKGKANGKTKGKNKPKVDPTFAEPSSAHANQSSYAANATNAASATNAPHALHAHSTPGAPWDDAPEPAANTSNTPESPFTSRSEPLASVLHAEIDAQVTLVFDQRVTRSAIDELVETLAPYTRHVRYEGLTDGGWSGINLAAPFPTRELRAGLQLANRNGPLTAPELDEFFGRIQAYAESQHAVVQTGGSAEAQRQAKHLDQFCADVDIEVAVNLAGRDGKTFANAQLKEFALAAGLKQQIVGFLAESTPNHPLFALRPEGSAARRETGHAARLSFVIDVPHVANGGVAFDAMLAMAHRVIAEMGGELVDDRGIPLGEAGLATLKRTIIATQEKMALRGIHAGSALATRLFS